MQRSDLALRLLALAIAVGLFFVVSGERRVTTNAVVPLAAAYPPGLVPAAPLPSSVSVSLTGPWARLRIIDRGSLGPVSIDLSHEAPGTHPWYVRPESLRLPRGVRVEAIHPAQGTVELRRGPFVEPPPSNP